MYVQDVYVLVLLREHNICIRSISYNKIKIIKDKSIKKKPELLYLVVSAS